MGLIINVDGGARGNPGPAGAGVVIRSTEGERVHEAGYFLGRQTNNYAEYTALIRALERVQRCPAQPLLILSDSQLLVRQLTGEYQVKSPTIAPLFRQIQTLLLRIANWSVRHIPREENAEADRMANLAMDEGADVIAFDVDDPANLGQRGGSRKRPPSGGEPGRPSGGESAAVSSGAGKPAAAGRVADADVDSDRAAPGESGSADREASAARRVVVQTTRMPAARVCPAAPGDQPVHIGVALPAGLCVHAAHALLPTVLAVINTAAGEFRAVPAMIVRCSKPECGALFSVGPSAPMNGDDPGD